MLGGEYKKLFDFIVEIQTGCLSCEDINDGAVMPSACVCLCTNTGQMATSRLEIMKRKDIMYD